MAWRCVCPLVFLFLASCTPKLPIEVWIDSSFQDDEVETIFSAMEKWENGTGINIFDFQDFIEDDFNFEDLDDDRHVIYRLSKESGIDTEIDTMSGETSCMNGLGGYGLRTDILMFWHNIANYNDFVCATEEYQDECSLRIELSDKNLEEMRQALLLRFESVLLHELGHFIGLGHDTHHLEAIMHPVWKSPDLYLDINERDVEIFCNIHNC